MDSADELALTDELLLVPFPSIGLPDAPGPELDPYLDAAARCFARHGIRRTTVPDIAKEAATSRTTVYRQLGTVGSAVGLLFARELHRALGTLPDSVKGMAGPDSVVIIMEAIVTISRTHPVLAKVLSDEPELMVPFLTSDFADIISRVSSVVAPMLERGMEADHIRRSDPAILAEFLLRTAVSLLLAPPGDIRAYLEATLMPALRPA